MPTSLFSNYSGPQSVANVSSRTDLAPVIESELVGTSIPRVARLSKSYLTTRRVLWNVLFVAIGLLGFFWRRDYDTWNALIARGTLTDAVIYNKHFQSGKSTSYYLDYRFDTAAGAIEGVDKVDYSTYDNTDIGAKLTVTYLPEQEVSKWQLGQATPQRRDDQSLIWLGCGVGGATCFGIAIGVMAGSANRHLRFLREGIAVLGQVTSGEVIRGKYTTYRLHYSYQVSREPYAGIIDVTASKYKTMIMENPYFTVIYDTSAPSVSVPYFTITDAYLVAAVS